MKKAIFLLMSLMLLSSCLPDKAKNPQASHGTCNFLWISFKDSMRKAYEAQGINKVYYSQIAQMNLSTILARGCCQYDDTCPASISE